jgi:enoyl-CoA hydratase/carnithine racemase
MISTGPPSDLFGLHYEKLIDGVAVITLDRPECGNALHPRMGPDFVAIWEDIRVDPSVRAVVVAAAGERYFCTGADLAAIDETGSIAADGPIDDVLVWTARQRRVWKPMVTAVEGLVVGGGLHFVVDADVVVASRAAAFMDAHVNVGFVGGVENVGLSKRLPLGTALRMSLQGRDYRLDAMRAHELGLVDELTEPGGALDGALAIARDIAAASPSAVALTRQAIWQSLESPYHEALDNAWALVRTQWSHPDSTEGPAAFVQGRPPRWTVEGAGSS